MILLPAAGGCQCGACRYQVDAQPYVAYTCHCLACQQLSSSAFMTCMHVPSEHLRMTAGQPHLRRRVADSGNTLTTSFCSRCGSAMVVANSARPRVRTVYTGTLDDAATVPVNAHIWVSRKWPWLELPADHRLFEQSGDWAADYGGEVERLLGN